MHSSLVRLQNVFGFFTTAASIVATCVALSVLLFPTSPVADVSVRNVQVVKGRPHYHSYKKEEYAHIKFDLEADFTSLFNWNTKQLFVYVLATYPSQDAESPPSSAIIWDTIVNSYAQANSPWTLDYLKDYIPLPSSNSKPTTKTSKAKSKAKAAKADKASIGKLSLKNVKPKYQITDATGILAERSNVTLEVGWNVQPWVGALTWTMPEGVSRGRWQGMQGGRSKSFDMPPLKGKKPEQIVGEQGTPRAGSAEPVVGRQHA